MIKHFSIVLVLYLQLNCSLQSTQQSKSEGSDQHQEGGSNKSFDDHDGDHGNYGNE
jgi:hypothetical protein